MARRKKTKNFGIKALGEKDLIIGIALIILGGILAAAPKQSNLVWFVALVLSMLGVILAGLGINNYLGK